MSILTSPDGCTSLELINTDHIDENGSKSYSFTCKVNSHGFVAAVENLWFYKEDLLEFADKLDQLLTASSNSEVVLRAMSDFTCTVEPSDMLGHFILRTTLESPVHQNTASLVTEAETQTLADLIVELRGIVQNP